MGKIASYAVLSMLVLKIPGVKEVMLKAGGTVAKVPLVAGAGISSAQVSSVLAGTTADIILLTIPEMYEDIKNKEGWKQIAKNTVLSIGENLLWNIGSEVVITLGKKLVGSLFDKGSVEILDEVDEVVGDGGNKINKTT